MWILGAFDKKEKKLSDVDACIVKFLKSVARRGTVKKWIDAFALCEACAAAVGLAINLISMFIPIYYAPLYGFLAMLIGFIASLAYAFANRYGLSDAAAYADAAGLKEKLATSLELIGEEDGFAGLLKEAAAKEIFSFDKKKSLPFEYPKKTFMAAFLACAAMIFFMLAPSYAKKEAAETHTFKMQTNEIEDKIKKAQNQIKNMKKTGEDGDKAKNILKALKDARKEVSGAKEAKDVKKTMERLELKIKNEFLNGGDEELARAADTLAPGADLEALAEYGNRLAQIEKKGKIGKAAVSELENLGKQLDKIESDKLLNSLEKSMKDGKITDEEAAKAMYAAGASEVKFAAEAVSNPKSFGNNNLASKKSSTSTGSGDGSRGGRNLGGDSGIMRKKNEEKKENIYLPGADEDVSLTGRKGEGAQSERQSRSQSAKAGKKKNIDAVAGEYSSRAYAKIEENEVPSEMKDVVKKYFSAFSD